MFTPRESTVLTELRKGRSNKEIGRALGISPFTVRQHLQAIGRKIGTTNRLTIAITTANVDQDQVLHTEDVNIPPTETISALPEHAEPAKSTMQELSKADISRVAGGATCGTGSLPPLHESAWVLFQNHFIGVNYERFEYFGAR